VNAIQLSLGEIIGGDMSPLNLPGNVWLWIMIFGSAGWACSSLDQLAGWSESSFATKLEIVRGVLVSLCAAVLAYFVLRLAGGSEPLSFFSAFGAAWGGDSGLRSAIERMQTRGPPPPGDGRR
jgi:hypothetical protein